MKWGQPVRFAAPELDAFLERWLERGLTPGELREWSQVLMYDSAFRESFCDWLKALREPAWSPARRRGGGGA